MAVMRMALVLSLLGFAGAATLGWLGTPSPGDAGAPATDPEALSRSIAFFEGKLAGDPWNTPVAARLADRYMLRFQLAADMSDVRRAAEVADDLAGRSPDPAGAFVRLSGIRLAQHDFGGAVDAAETALGAGSPAADAALGAAFDAWFAVGRYEDARAAMEEMDPGSLDGLLRRARWAEHEERTGDAAASMGAVCEQLRRRGSWGQLHAWCLTELGKLAEVQDGPSAARLWFERALAVQPGYRGAVEGLADLAAAAGDHRTALARYRTIATDAHPDLYLRIAESLTALDRRGEVGPWHEAFLRVALQPGAEPLHAPALARFLAEEDRDPLEALRVAEREVERRPTVESRALLTEMRATVEAWQGRGSLHRR